MTLEDRTADRTFELLDRLCHIAGSLDDMAALAEANPDVRPHHYFGELLIDVSDAIDVLLEIEPTLRLDFDLILENRRSALSFRCGKHDDDPEADPAGEGEP